MSVIKPLLLTLLLSVVCLPGAARADYALVWGDEFDGTTLDTADWNYDIGDGCPNLCGWGNNELEYYRSENVAVQDGHLIITAKQESYGGRYFTSGKIHTRNKHSFLYGRMEMRAKIPSGQGLWPAFWMMPEDGVYGGWARSGELDILESINVAEEIHGTIHFGGEWPNNSSSGGSYASGIDFGDDFHIYAVEWEETEIRWYIDGILYSTKTSNQWWSDGAPGNPLAPFDQPFYLILNCAVGGNWPGCTNPSCITGDLPAEYVVDYVRVYQESANAAPTVTITSPTEGDTPPAGDIIIEAEAADSDGSIDRIEFYSGSGFIGLADTAPFSVTWENVSSGCYEVVAKAYDDDGSEATDTLNLTVGAGCGQVSYTSPMPLVPTRIEAEHYDLGGQGVAYHDLDSDNNGGAFRPLEGVDIENCSDVGGGYNVGWIRTGEWLEYSLVAGQAGVYDVRVRVACFENPGTFHLELGGVDVTGPISVPVTGGWQTWTDVTATIDLTVGQHLLRFVCDDTEFNLNYFEFTGPNTSAAGEVPQTGMQLHPCHPNPFNPSTTITFELPAAMPASLTVYDVSGGLVQRLISGETLPQGRSEVVWRGRDEAGHVVPAGVYFYRLDTAAGSETRRMLLLK